jgi:hypothetical protein
MKHAKNQGRGATLLVGAGCSASAGIKVASEVVEVIEYRRGRGASDDVTARLRAIRHDDVD